MANERKQLAQSASKQRSDKWFCRVDGSKEFLTQKCKELVGCIDVRSFLGAFHLGERKENPHIHFVVEINKPVQKQSFAIRVKDLFAIDKKTQYALAVWDGERGVGACSYLFHEEDVDIVANKGFTDDDIKLARDANLAVQKVVEINMQKASKKLVEKCYEYFKAGVEFSRHQAILYMLKEIRVGEHYHPGEYMLKRYVEEIEVKLSNDLPGLAWEITNRLWRN